MMTSFGDPQHQESAKTIKLWQQKDNAYTRKENVWGYSEILLRFLLDNIIHYLFVKQSCNISMV